MSTTETGRPRRPRAPKIMVGVGAALALGALAWVLFAVPALVKYPTDVDVSPKYEGTFELFVDAATAAPLEEPLELPLAVDRHIEAVGDESGASTVVVKETIRQRAGDLVDSTYTNVYVMDRRTLENVDDPRAYAFSPENKVDRSPSYRVHLPFGTEFDGTYRIYKNETDDTYTLGGATSGPETYETEGLTLTRMEPRTEPQPLSEAYLAQLNKAVPLPESLTLDQLKPQLLAMGLDVDATLAALLPALSPEDLETLSALAAEPIPLEYMLSFTGNVGVETTTGSEVEVAVQETLGARPVLANVEALADVLGRYPQVPEAVAAVETLDELATAPPIPIFSVDYAQTDASVADIAGDVKDQRQMVLLAQRWVPLGLVVVSLVLLAIGAGLMIRDRRRGAPVAVAGQKHGWFDRLVHPRHA